MNLTISDIGKKFNTVNGPQVEVVMEHPRKPGCFLVKQIQYTLPGGHYHNVQNYWVHTNGDAMLSPGFFCWDLVPSATDGNKE